MVSNAVGNVSTIQLAWGQITLAIGVGSKSDQKKRFILDKIDGEALPGEMLAVMGPSGSGKTSLLNVLARRNDAFTGTLKMNGLDMSGRGLLFNTRTAYMHQDERFLPALTVKEHLMYQVRLRTSLARAECDQRVDAIMMELGLDKIATHVIGELHGSEGAHISRSERKRLSFASELLTNPTLLFVDESTTGLDSHMAESVVKTLKGLASGLRKCTIVATIHQPAADTYRLFDKVCFLVGGRVAYFGRLPEMVEFLSGLGYPLPTHCCPADHIMRLFVNPNDPKGSEQRRKQIISSFAASVGKHIVGGSEPQATAPAAIADQVATTMMADCEARSSRSFCMQVWILTLREIAMRLRTNEMRMRIVQTLLFGVWFGLTYFRLKITQSSFFTVSAALFLTTMTVFVGSPANVAQTVPSQVPVFVREQRSGSYNIAAMFVSKMLVDIPTEGIITLIASLSVYWLGGFRGDRMNGDFTTELHDFFPFWAVLWLIAYNVTCYGYFTAFAAPVNVPMLGLLAAFALLMPQLIFGGFFINLDVIPAWLLWIRDICMLRYSFSLMNIVQWDSYGHVPCDGARCLFSPGATGKDVLKQLVGDDTVLKDIMALLAISVFFRLLAWRMLVLKVRPAVFDSAIPDAGTITLEDPVQSEAEESLSVAVTRSPITVTWSQVAFAPAGRRVLDNISGIAKPGRLLAVMGPSGSGKTSLLNTLTGCNKDITGSVLFNGEPWEAALASQVGYMHQEDMFFPDLTVREHLSFTSMLKMPPGVTKLERGRRVDSIVRQMGLTTCQNTCIGTIGAGISGGERKRLSLGAELLCEPAVLVVDEPTSGLDSAMAESVIQLLGKLASGGDGSAPRTVIATVHQPSRDVFLNFSDLLILADGGVAYLGEAAKAVEYFADMCYACPLDTNPPEHFMRLVSNHLGADKSARQESMERICTIISQHSKMERTGAQAMPMSHAKTGDAKIEAYHTSTGRQFMVLFRRETLLRGRSKIAFKFVAVRTLIVTLLVGSVWFQLDTTGELRVIQAFMGALQFMLLYQLMTSAGAMAQTIPVILPAALRDNHNGLYSMSSWYLSKVFADMPFETFFASIFCTGVFFLVGFGNIAADPVEMWLMLVGMAILTAQAGNAIGFMCSALTAEPSTAMSLGFMLIFPWLFYGGLMINFEEIPVYFSWVQWTSPFKYMYTFMTITVFQDADFHCPPSVACQYRDGMQILEQFSMKPSEHTRSLVASVCLVISFRLITWMFLVFRASRISVYIYRCFKWCTRRAKALKREECSMAPKQCK